MYASIASHTPCVCHCIRQHSTVRFCGRNHYRYEGNNISPSLSLSFSPPLSIYIHTNSPKLSLLPLAAPPRADIVVVQPVQPVPAQQPQAVPLQQYPPGRLRFIHTMTHTHNTCTHTHHTLHSVCVLRYYYADTFIGNKRP